MKQCLTLKILEVDFKLLDFLFKFSLNLLFCFLKLALINKTKQEIDDKELLIVSIRCKIRIKALQGNQCCSVR